ncbi:SNF2 helicase associated domain-containing protein [[Clostridium] symbiosum]|uniref:SNF2 helicase associated domain-containing protein n=1 Tax=Clostridium symbiosum TaxID=1512 RepID=UPI001D07CEDA|nr:SNF2 helicase associated domain-containing protein [[Clostridium] symbiosum]MCB6607667.1 SNF2 helicase associated domain-containing protein [[Clostridium] symbiosum]MCB6929344.1 SNF2 helicase associated domain-containing protein [[Clostridium] symbiosum]
MNIRDMAVDTFWKGEVRVQAVVEDGDGTYNTRIFIKNGEIYDYHCTCALGNSYKGACVHGRTLLKEYGARERENRSIPISTSPSVRTMIREYTNREVARIMGEEISETVSLVPRLIVGHRGVSLECRIKEKRQYLIKDLGAFSDAVRTGKRVEYGKGLAFEHSLSAFTPESRPLVQMVIEETGIYREHFEDIRKRTNTTVPLLNTIFLSKPACDRFFAIMEGNVIDTEDYKGHRRELLLLKGKPAFYVHAKRIGREGIEISVPEELMAFQGEKSLYVADENCLYCCDRESTEILSLFLKHILSEPGGTRRVRVNERDIPLFYERVLKGLDEAGLLKTEGIDWEQYRPGELKARFEFDSSEPGEIALKPTLSYGDFSFHPLDDERIPKEICRDVPGEFRISRLITKYFEFRENNGEALVIREDEDAIYRLLSEGMDRFREIGEVWVSENVRNIRVLEPPRISLGVSVNGNWLDLKVDAQGMTATEMAGILSEYRQKKQYCRMKNGDFLRLDDDGLLTLLKLSDGLALGKNDFQSGVIKLPVYRAFYLESLVRENGHIPFSRDSCFKTIVRDLQLSETVGYEPPDEQGSVLREYQKAGFVWMKMLDVYRFGGILADDMGLGKTLQMITLLVSEKEERKEDGGDCVSLVVCPASLIYNWGHEIAAFAPSLKVLLVTGPQAERQKELEHIKEYDVVVTSYDLLKRDLPFYMEHTFRFEVIDEAQYIKNASTQSAKAVKAVRAVTRFALTGTPVENRLSELWSIFDYLMPGFLFTYRKFKTMFEIPIVKEQSGEALENLHRMIRPFILRRLKKDVLKELPDKLEKVVYSAPEGKQKTLYQAAALKLRQSLLEDETAVEGGGKLQILAELTRLRQLCCDPSLCFERYSGESAKLETCISLIASAVESGHKILLFSQFTSMLAIIGQRLKKEEISYHLLVGSTPKEERNRMVNDFHRDGVPVFLISLKAGGTGLNLTAADIVIHYDPWWNVAAQNQATDRAHRIGQSRQVTVYKLIMKDTIEENILNLQEAKKNLADQIVTEGMVSLAELSREELIRILS